MSQRPPTSPDPIEALLRAQGLQQPAAAFSAALTRQVVARYAAPPVVPYRAGAWLGKAILLVLAMLLGLVTYGLPGSVSTVLATSLAAAALGLGGMIWLLEQHRQGQFA